MERDHHFPGQEQQERLKGIVERAWGAQRRQAGGQRGERLSTHMLEAYVEFFSSPFPYRIEKGGKKEGKK